MNEDNELREITRILNEIDESKNGVRLMDLFEDACYRGNLAVSSLWALINTGRIALNGTTQAVIVK